MIQNCKLKTLERLFTKLFAKLTEKGRSKKNYRVLFNKLNYEKY